MPSVEALAAQWPALGLAEKVERLRQGFQFAPGPLAEAVTTSMPAARRAAEGIGRRDPSTWSRDAAVQQQITNRLGWLTSPHLMLESLDRLIAFADDVRADGFTDVVLLGMGGSSLAPEVLRSIIGSAPGYPTLHVLDSTDPAAIQAVATDIERTLYILASKSGTTIEPNSLAAHFRSRLESAGVGRWAQRFVAITDAGTELAARAAAEGFRDVFINPSDIGGRYSALSFFGLVPAALMGQDIRSLVAWGMAMLAASDATAATGATSNLPNPSLPLGLLMGSGAKAGRDKLTLLLPSRLEPFGLWVEQLVAESTGKHGVGVVPVAGEPLDAAALEGADRVFASIDLPAVEGATPLFSAQWPDKSALGAEFVRWELATAIAGALLDINPFDEPNVQQAKDATRTLLDRYKADGRLPTPRPDVTVADGTTFTLSDAARRRLAATPSAAHAQQFLTLLGEGDYLAVLAYLGPASALYESLRSFRLRVHKASRRATTIGYGPRYLHSTGQLHKGGPNNGVFVIVTATPDRDEPIPGEVFSFGTLEHAQALGDFSALDAGGRRAILIHAPTPSPAVIDTALGALLEPFRPNGR